MQVLLLIMLGTVCSQLAGGLNLYYLPPQQARIPEPASTTPPVASTGAPIETTSSTPKVEAPPPEEVSQPAEGALSPEPCSELCPFNYDPVCGSDEVTYTNPCSFNNAVCRNPDIVKSYHGPCVPFLFDAVVRIGTTSPRPDGGAVAGGDNDVSPACRAACTRIYLPLCASNGKTYNNRCTYELDSCLSQQAGGPPITVVAEGPCDDTVISPGALDPVHAEVGESVPPGVQDPIGSGAGDSIVPGIDPVVEVPAVPGAETPVSPAGGAPASSCKENCQKIYIPVCGSDGVTYNNPCILGEAHCKSLEAGGSGVALAYDGVCEQSTGPEAVPSEQVPGTPSDPKVDSRVTPAPASSCPEQCTRIFTPVCGSDGVSYNNLCLLEIADCRSREAGGTGVVAVSDGYCGEPVVPGAVDPVGPVAVDPVGPVAVDPVGPVAVDPVGPGVEAPVSPAGGAPASSCNKSCQKIYIPVCGSDGVTYNNLCLLEIADCRSREAGGTGVVAVSDGRCGVPVVEDDKGEAITSSSTGVAEEDTKVEEVPAYIPPVRTSTTSCRSDCTNLQEPVCGSDGVTYENECILDVASCRRREDGGEGIYIVSGGSCDDIKSPVEVDKATACREQCTKIYLPVCGSDGNTYDNECLLDVVNCKRWEEGGKGIYIIHEGRCEDEGIGDLAVPSVPDQSLAAPIDSPSETIPSPSVPVESPLLASLGVSYSASTSPCPEQCAEDYSPVCGTDNLTYDSHCVLEETSCRRRSAGDDIIRKAFDGPCVAALPRGPVCDRRCDGGVALVCGSDGETYNSRCLLEHADCLNPFATIAFVKDGPCDSSITLLELSSSSSSEDDSDTEDVAFPHLGYLPPF